MIDRAKEKRIEFSDIAKALDENLSQADLLRSAGLERLQKVRSAGLSGQQREQERLRQAPGPDHPRVAALAQKVEANRDLIREVGIHLERASIETPKADDSTWVLHGRVYSKELRGAPNLTVGLHDQKGKWLEVFGHVCTDRTGYFRLSHGLDPAIENPRESEKRGADSVAEGQHLAVFIRLQDPAGAQVFVDSRPLMPEPGKVDYREIVFGDEGGTCPPPKRPARPRK